VAVSFMGQGVMKQVLTEGEKYLMTFLNLLTFSEQGLFEVVSNLGALAARFIFRPIEEQLYFFFSQQWIRGKSWDEQPSKRREEVVQGLTRSLRLMLLFGLVIFVFGFSYADLVLRLYGGANLVAGTSLLRAQCALVALLAVNGVTECFARSVMTDAEINKFSSRLVVLSASYLALAWLLTHLVGPVGLVLANYANMAMRIWFAIQVIEKTFHAADMSETTSNEVGTLPPSPLISALPDRELIMMIVCSGTCCQMSEQFLYFWSPAVHFVLGTVLFLVTLFAVIIKEEFILAFIVSKYRSYTTTKTKAD